MHPYFNKYIRTDLGYIEPKQPYCQHCTYMNPDGQSYREDFADMFMAYFMGYFSNDKAGRLRKEYMREFIYSHFVKDNLFLLVKIFPLLIISLIGMITRFNRAILYLILIFLYSIFLYPIFFVDERYLASAIPALAIFFLFGLFDIIKLCNNKIKGFKFPLTNNSKLLIIAIVCILFLFSTLFIGIFLDSKYQKLDQATEQKIAGLWLKNYDPGSIVMARKPWVSFYSNGIFVISLKSYCSSFKETSV